MMLMMLPIPTPRRRLTHHPAFTLIEAMVMLVVMSIIAVGVSTALRSASAVPESADRIVAVATELNSEMETWRALAWGSSPWPASLPYTLNDTVTLPIAGQSVPLARTLTIQNWDPTNLTTNTTPKTNFVRIQLTIGGQTLTTYLTSPN